MKQTQTHLHYKEKFFSFQKVSMWKKGKKTNSLGQRKKR